MPDLRWIDADPGSKTVAEIPRGTRVKAGKPLWLWGDGYADPPDRFYPLHRLGFVMRAYCNRKNRPTFVSAARSQLIRSHEDGWVSTKALKLTPGRRMSWIVFFKDEAGNTSDDIRVSSLVEFEPPQAGALGFSLKLPFRFVTVVDPVIELSVLTPWAGEEWESYLDELVAPAVAGGDTKPEARAFLEEQVLEGYLPEERPQGWDFVLDEHSFELDEGESAEVTLTVEMPTPGATAFAVQARAVIDGEEFLDVSDLIVVRMPEDGSATAELFGGDEGDGGSGEARETSSDSELISGASVEPVTEDAALADAT